MPQATQSPAAEPSAVKGLQHMGLYRCLHAVVDARWIAALLLQWVLISPGETQTARFA